MKMLGLKLGIPLLIFIAASWAIYLSIRNSSYLKEGLRELSGYWMSRYWQSV